MHEERAAVSRRKLFQTAFEVEVFDIGLRRRLAMNDVNHGRQPEPWRPTQVAALVGDDGEEPGTDGHPGPELMELAPGARQRLLGGVLGVAPISQHRQGEAQARFDQWADQRFEGRFVAREGSEAKRLVSRQAQGVCHTL